MSKTSNVKLLAAPIFQPKGMECFSTLYSKDYKSKKVQVFSLPELNMIGTLPNNYNYNDVLTFINLKKSQKYESNIK